MLCVVFILLTIVGFLFYEWMTRKYNYFKDNGIPHGKPVFFFGTGKDLLMKKLSLPEYIQKWYNEFPDEK